MKGEVHSHLEENIRPYIDLIDTLRSVGIHKDLALPTIVVIGDQSSGKSSVLEALSGVALPRGSGIVTRCPLELRLKKVTGVNWKALIMCMLTAQNELAGKGVGISDEVITLEVMSPDVCDLTLIDLPGIARVPLKGQPEDIGEQIKSLIFKFIEKQETINLVVVPCNTDIATTEALKMAQEVDPEGKRTVAILTKPDLIDKGTEKSILKIVHNEVIDLRKGCIMVKCRGQQQINDDIPLEEAAQMERDFFQNHDYFRCLLKKDKATIKCLAIKLTQELVDHIKVKILATLKECDGGPPQDPKGAKQFLTQTLKRFNDQINSLSSGELILEENLFAQLRAEFKKWNDHLNRSKKSFSNSKAVSQANRGRELPGISNYKVFETALQQHVAKLEEPANDLLGDMKGTSHNFVFKDVLVLNNFNNFSTCGCFKINNILSSQQEKAEQRISEQFKMENLIYTQDPMFLKILSEITNEQFSEEQLPMFDKKCKYSHMLEAHYEIVVQRMADQLPMMISLFMLKETADLLSTDILGLLDGANVSELLFEDSDVSKRRKDLLARLDRLTAAQAALAEFI
uniref:Interferon-induced GTP-binding protein Mx3-like n=1 Tax=Sinocyclocheilus rhinocerous TaxID=307959 RepID=A0A673G3R5_9TELE